MLEIGIKQRSVFGKFGEFIHPTIINLKIILTHFAKYLGYYIWGICLTQMDIYLKNKA